MHEFVRRFQDVLDAVTGDKLHIEYLGNPNELGTQYKRVRTQTQAARDDAGAEAYERQLKQGVSPEHIRRQETGALIRRLGLSYADLPCIPFASIPACGRMAMLKIDRRWLTTDEGTTELLDALVDFFSTDPLIQAVDKPVISAESMGGFESRLVGAIQARMHGRTSPPGSSHSRTVSESKQVTYDPVAEEAASFCAVLTEDGRRRINKNEYEGLLRERESYDMFIDGLTRCATARGIEGAIRQQTLTKGELGMLIEFVRAARPMRPSITQIGKQCASVESACRMFREARKKVDVRLSRYRFRSFHLMGDPSDLSQNSYHFKPPQGLRYCVICPVP